MGFAGTIGGPVAAESRASSGRLKSIGPRRPFRKLRQIYPSLLHARRAQTEVRAAARVSAGLCAASAIVVGFRLARRVVFGGRFGRRSKAATQVGGGGIALALIVRPLIQKPGMDIFYARFL
jgi:hypothetical protein